MKGAMGTPYHRSSIIFDLHCLQVPSIPLYSKKSEKLFAMHEPGEESYTNQYPANPGESFTHYGTSQLDTAGHEYGVFPPQPLDTTQANQYDNIHVSTSIDSSFTIPPGNFAYRTCDTMYDNEHPYPYRFTQEGESHILDAFCRFRETIELPMRSWYSGVIINASSQAVRHICLLNNAGPPTMELYPTIMKDFLRRAQEDFLTITGKGVIDLPQAG